MTEWVVRGSQWSKEVQVAEVRADDTLILADQQGHWQVPPHTKSLSWKVVLKEGAGESSYDPEEPRWILSEATSMLRLKGEPKPPWITFHPERANHSSMGTRSSGDDHAWRFPSMDAPPEFWALGALHTIRRNVQGITFEHVVEEPAHPRWKQWIPDHTALVELLCQLFEPHNPSGSQLKKVEVIWRKVSIQQGRISGLSGGHSLLVDYIHDGSSRELFFKTFSMTVAAHEHFHQFCDATFTAHDCPPWIYESLAQFAALKIMQGSPLPTEEVHAVRSRFIQPSRPVEKGLITWAERASKQDPAATMAFYQQGSTFWSALDELLLKASGGATGVLDALPSLMQHRYEGTQNLPPGLVQNWRRWGGPEVDVLLRRYVHPKVDIPNTVH